MPSLQHLRYCSGACTDFLDLIANVQAPSLKSLTLKNLELRLLSPNWTAPQLPQFPSLKIVVLIQVEITEEAGLQLSDLVSNASMLVISGTFNPQFPWDEDSTPEMWRNLESIVLDVPQRKYLTPFQLQSFCRSHPNLKTLHVRSDWRIKSWKHLLGSLSLKRRDVELMKFRELSSMDPCLGAWPPGTEGDGGIADPFWDHC
ncbi:hypothetical protein NMY22_g14901 [Coprinellus aureogranulatus]|nr:hypothetical protein NMY22_g14901 [Coprinellus aureogranulatus]